MRFSRRFRRWPQTKNPLATNPRHAPQGFLICPERQMKFVGYLGPEFAHDVPAHICADAPAGPAGQGLDVALVSRMIEVADLLGACRSQPFGIIEHQVSGITMRYKDVTQR